MLKNLKFLRSLIGIYFVGWLIFSPVPSEKIIPQDFGSINRAVQNQYSQDEQSYLLNKNSNIILASNSSDDSDTEGIVESDIEEDTQFVLPPEIPGLLPIMSS